MTVSEFEEQSESLQCRACGRVGLTLEHVTTNNGHRAACPACGARGAKCYGPEFLPKGGGRRATAKSGELREVWKVNGDHCGHCGKSWDLCARLSIGRTRQHVFPVALGGSEDGVVIPYCARCQEASAAALKETRDYERELTSLDDIIRRIEANHPELLQ